MIVPLTLRQAIAYDRSTIFEIKARNDYDSPIKCETSL
jgi:hypothetical protein